MARTRGGTVARPQASESTKLAAIIFAATTFFALLAAVLLYTELRKQWEEVARAKTNEAQADARWQEEMKRAEGLGKVALDDPKAKAEGFDKTLYPGRDFKPVVLTEEIDGKPISLADLIDKLRGKVSSLQEENNELKQSVENVKADYATKEQELISSHQIKEEEISKLRKDLESERDSSRRLTEDYEDKISTQRDEVRALRQKIVDVEKSQKNKLEELTVEVENLRTRIKELQKPPGEVIAFFEFDGKVLSSDSRYKTCTVNLGRKDGVRPGYIFEIYPPGKPQEENLKGKIEIRDVNLNIATARILIEEETNPLMPGDEIYNPLYDKGKQNVFALVGEFEAPRTSEWTREMVEEHGGKAMSEVDEGTNYVILGAAFEHSEKYKKAKDMGIEVLRVETLDKFFGR